MTLALVSTPPTDASIADDHHHHQSHVEDRHTPPTISSPGRCKPLGKFASCYDVAVPVFHPHLGADDESSDVQMPVTLSAFGRPFNLRLRVDRLSEFADDSKPGESWSSVLSPSAFVRVKGEGNSVQEYDKDNFGITWLVGYNSAEVARSPVLGSIVNTKDRQLFRAVIRTSSDVFYVEPASDHPEVNTRCVQHLSLTGSESLIGVSASEMTYWAISH